MPNDTINNKFENKILYTIVTTVFLLSSESVSIKKRKETASELAAKVSMKRLVNNEILVVMISYMGFTTKELSAHKVLLNEFCKLPFAQDQIYAIERRFRKKKKSKGYVIAAIRDEVNSWKEIQNKSRETKTE